MEWSERMNTAIAYIEDNLADEIDYREAAKKACCSLFHFQRMFFAITSVTPAEYTRRRRLTLAATELTLNNVKVIDLAVKYGYDSPDAFTRAFRSVHGVNPQAAREPGVKLTAFPRVSFHIKLEGENDMDYRIVEKPAFDILGRSRKIGMMKGGNATDVQKFWADFIPTKDHQRLSELARKPGPIMGGNMLGVALLNENGGYDPFIYAISVEKTKKMEPEGFEVFHVQAATYAVFDCTMAHLLETVKRIWSEWFPSTGYEHDMKPEIELFFWSDIPGDPDQRCQLWYPVVQKKRK